MAHQAVLTWTASADAVQGYNIYRGTAAGQETTKVNGTTPVTETTYTDTPLPPGPVFYVVRAVENGVESVNSNEVSAVILPAAPTALSISAS